MTTDDNQRAAGSKLMGTLWPQMPDLVTNERPTTKLAPEFFDYVQQTAFGMIWSRPGLATRDRSLITCAMLAALGLHDELRPHLAGALNVGVTRDELIEAIMHVSIYAGVPAAVNALGVAAEVLGTDD